jgi:hypothetical protein
VFGDRDPMTALPPTSPHSPFAGLPGRSASAGVRVTVALAVVAVVTGSAATSRLEAIGIPISLLVFLAMALLALGAARCLHKAQSRSHGGRPGQHRTS